MIAAPVVVWRFYGEWRLGRVELMTVDAPVVCQVLAEASDTPIGEPFDLVTRAAWRFRQATIGCTSAARDG